MGDDTAKPQSFKLATEQSVSGANSPAAMLGLARLLGQQAARQHFTAADLKEDADSHD